MKIRITWAAVAAASLVLAAGCGSDDDKSSSTSASTPTTTQQDASNASAPAGNVPSFEDVKKLATDDPKVKDRCAKSSEVQDIGSSPAGEQYKRLSCNDEEILDYVVGKENFKDNFEAAKGYAKQPVWKLGDQAYVKVSAFGASEDYAKKIKSLCGCGEVVDAG